MTSPNNKTIAIIGLGYVGLPLAVEFGKKRNVIGFDINARRVAELQSGQDHTLECSPEELAQANHLRYSCDAPDLKKVQVFIVTVPTFEVVVCLVAASVGVCGAGWGVECIHQVDA